MGVYDPVCVLNRRNIGALLVLVFAILSFVLTVCIVSAGADRGGDTPSGDFIRLPAAVASGPAIVIGAAPVGATTGSIE